MCEFIIFALIVFAAAGFAAGVAHIGLSILKGLGY
jgi:hypothetical protein